MKVPFAKNRAERDREALTLKTLQWPTPDRSPAIRWGGGVRARRLGPKRRSKQVQTDPFPAAAEP